jgi:hypothetical protein
MFETSDPEATEATRYNNPLKVKLKAKRLAAEGLSHSHSSSFHT